MTAANCSTIPPCCAAARRPRRRARPWRAAGGSRSPAPHALRPPVLFVSEKGCRGEVSTVRGHRTIGDRPLTSHHAATHPIVPAGRYDRWCDRCRPGQAESRAQKHPAGTHRPDRLRPAPGARRPADAPHPGAAGPPRPPTPHTLRPPHHDCRKRAVEGKSAPRKVPDHAGEGPVTSHNAPAQRLHHRRSAQPQPQPQEQLHAQPQAQPHTALTKARCPPTCAGTHAPTCTPTRASTCAPATHGPVDQRHSSRRSAHRNRCCASQHSPTETGGPSPEQLTSHSGLRPAENIPAPAPPTEALNHKQGSGAPAHFAGTQLNAPATAPDTASTPPVTNRPRAPEALRRELGDDGTIPTRARGSGTRAVNYLCTVGRGADVEPGHSADEAGTTPALAESTALARKPFKCPSWLHLGAVSRHGFVSPRAVRSQSSGPCFRSSSARRCPVSVTMRARLLSIQRCALS